MTIIAIIVVCLIFGLVVFPGLTRSLQRARAGRVVPPYDAGVNYAAGGDTSMPPYTVHVDGAGGGHDHAAGQATAVMVAVTPAAVTEAAAMVEEMVVVPAGAMEVAVVGSQQPSGDQGEEANP